MNIHVRERTNRGGEEPRAGNERLQIAGMCRLDGDDILDPHEGLAGFFSARLFSQKSPNFRDNLVCSACRGPVRGCSQY